MFLFKIRWKVNISVFYAMREIDDFVGEITDFKDKPWKKCYIVCFWGKKSFLFCYCFPPKIMLKRKASIGKNTDLEIVHLIMTNKYLWRGWRGGGDMVPWGLFLLGSWSILSRFQVTSHPTPHPISTRVKSFLWIGWASDWLNNWCI